MSGTFAWGGLTFTGQTTASVDGVGAFTFGSLTMIGTGSTTTPDGRTYSTPTVLLYDDTNTWHAACPLADGVKYGRTLSDPGFISLRLPYQDEAGNPVSYTTAAVAGWFFKVLEAGQIQQAAQIAGESVDMAVNGRLWRVFDNLPGVLDLTRKGVVWPEYGVDRTYSSTRMFGPMSSSGVLADRGVGWFSSGDWTYPTDPIRYQADTGFRQFKPAGLSFPNPHWIAKNGPYHDEDPGASQWHRKQITTYAPIKFQILTTFDDFGEVWLDGELVVPADPSQTQQWAQLFQVKGKLPAGLHVVAIRPRTTTKPDEKSPLASIFTMQQLRRNGDVVNGPPILNTHQFWNTSDVTAIGFRAADMVRRILFENLDLYGITGGLELVTPAFNNAHDSDGQPHDDDPDTHQADVGTPLLDVITSLDQADWGMDPDRFRLMKWNRKGSDKSGTVVIRRGQGNIGSLLSGGIDRTAPPPTVLLIQLADTTWKQYEDTAALTAGAPRVVEVVSAGSARTERQAQRIADQLFRENKLAAATFTATITSLDGPQLFSQCVEGDTIAYEDDHGDNIPVRIMGWLRDASGPGAPTTELELVLESV